MMSGRLEGVCLSALVCRFFRWADGRWGQADGQAAAGDACSLGGGGNKNSTGDPAVGVGR